MARKSVFKLSAIAQFFGNEPKLIEKGENALESNHIKSISFLPEIHVIKGLVEASMTKGKSYEVEMTLTEDGEIKTGSCECPRGQFRCHHMAALLLYGHYNISITDKACSWSKEKVIKGNNEIKSVSDLFPAKKFKATKDLSPNLKEIVFKDLQELKQNVGFSWLLSPEPETEDNTMFPCLEEILFSREFKDCENKELFLAEHCQLTEAQIAFVSEETIGQATNWKWSKYRKLRLTSSNFGYVLKAQERGRFPPSLFKRLMYERNLDGVKAVQWGKQNEQTAALAFQNLIKKELKDSGFWLHSSGLLGASPDKLIIFENGSHGTVEIKCPFKFRNECLDELIKHDNKYIIQKDDHGNYIINKKHEYYHQIQGQMHILKCLKSYLVIWTLKSCSAFLIEKDDSWSKNLEILKHFYINNFIPHLLNNKL